MIRAFEDAGLDPEAVARSRAVVDFDADEATCPACGTTFTTDATRCPECGLRFA